MFDPIELASMVKKMVSYLVERDKLTIPSSSSGW